ncbi:hypothetical protein AAMO2058_000593400 [Amorphochlora amoebiformis]
MAAPAGFHVMVAEDEGFKSMRGYVSVQGREFGVRVVYKGDGGGRERSLKGAVLYCDKGLSKLVEAHGNLVKQRFLQSPNLNSFLLELRDILDHALTLQKKKNNNNSALEISPSRQNILRKLVEQISQVGWGRIESIDPSLSNLKATLKDSNARIHTVRLSLPPNWPSSPPVALLDVPISQGKSPEDTKGGTIGEILERCKTRIDEYHDFWLAVEDFEKSTCVLEPTSKSRSSTRFRIVVKRHCSIQLDLEPLRPFALCEIRFMGSEAITGPLLVKLNSNISKWSERLLPRENLETILELKFPSGKEDNAMDFDMECGICYAYHLEQEDQKAVKEAESRAPDRVCENSKCGRPFHKSCLIEWLRAIPNTQLSFHTLFGKCPYCQSTISVDIN